DDEHYARADMGKIGLARWVLLTAVLDRQAHRFFGYVNGARVASQVIDEIGSLSSTWPAKTCGGHDRYDCFFAGKIDDIRIYDRALSATEIAALYAAPP